jgi:phage tail sheath gpL-like
MVDQSAIARVLGIETSYVDLRNGNTRFLPQQIALFAQGATASTYSSDRWEASGSDAAGKRYGYGSPIHLAMLELMPPNGNGVGTIPVTVYPLSDADGATAAAGSITPSGTATATKSYKVKVSGILSNGFTIAAGAIDVTEVCRVMGEAIQDIAKMPVLVDWTYGSPSAGSCQQGTGGTTGDGTVTGLAVTAGESPVPGVWTLTCTAAATDSGTFELVDPNGVVVDSAITVAVAETNCGGLAFTVADGTTDYAVGNYFLLTVSATAVEVEAKWAGETGNDIVLEVIDELEDLTFTIVQPTGGATNPTVDAAIAKVGSRWETLALNALNYDDTTALDTFQTWGEGRWAETVMKQLAVIVGNTEESRGTATVITSARTDDRINVQVVCPGSPNLPFVVAANTLARVAVMANNNPPTDYGALPLTGIEAGDDSVQWLDPDRNAAIRAGSSTIEVHDGVPQIGDIVTMYAPEGESPPGYRFLVDIIKLQNVSYNLQIEFGSLEWAGAPLIADRQPTRNENARRAKDATGRIWGILDGLAKDAILADYATAKEGSYAVINSQNARRLDMTVLCPLSGNTTIKSIALKFGFNYGG